MGTMPPTITIELTAKNQGQTPAREVRQFINAEARQFGNAHPGPIGAMSQDNWVMTPGTTWPLRFPDRERRRADGSAESSLGFDPTEVRAVAEDEREIIVWGRLTYLDVFPESNPRESLFCYRNGRRLALTEEEQRLGVEIKWEPEVCAIGNRST